MSGGVDSSVSATLLKKQRFEVTGLYLRLFKDEVREKKVKEIAEKIGIPLIIKDARKEFKKRVINYFISEYKAGRTPNPCVVCNQHIKFKFLFDELTKLRADFVATGHYARVKREIQNSKFEIRNKSKVQNSNFSYKLFQAKDKTKDQSYFLYTLNQKQLAKVLFPVGDYTKEEIKKLAQKFRLPLDFTEESRGICFVAEKWTDEFLRRNIKMRPGKIIDAKGNIIGIHQGLPLYTVGQRRNIRIGGTGPYYVVKKDLPKNVLVVVKNSHHPLLYKKDLLVKNINWITDKPRLPLEARVCIRYHHPAVRGIIKPSSHKNIKALKQRVYLVRFIKPQRAVTPGQSAVFYAKKGEVLGGGTIN